MIIVKEQTSLSITCDGVVFKMTMNNDYLVNRLAVQTDTQNNTPDIRRIYVPETELRTIAMNIMDVVERINSNTNLQWQDVLSKLESLCTGNNLHL